MNHSMLEYLVAAVVGLVLGVAYFGTLWLAVRHAMRTKSGAIVAATSLLRLGALLVGIYFATQAEWQLVLVCVTCLLVGRQIVFAATAGFVTEASS